MSVYLTFQGYPISIEQLERLTYPQIDVVIEAVAQIQKQIQSKMPKPRKK